MRSQISITTTTPENTRIALTPTITAKATISGFSPFEFMRNLPSGWYARQQQQAKAVIAVNKGGRHEA